MTDLYRWLDAGNVIIFGLNGTCYFAYKTYENFTKILATGDMGYSLDIFGGLILTTIMAAVAIGFNKIIKSSGRESYY